MALKKVYRTCMITGLTAAALFTAACSSDTPQSHETIKQESYKKWNLAKIGVEYQLAQQQYAVGDYDKCRATLRDAMALNQPHAGLQMLAGKVDIEKGDLDAAATHLKESIHIDPGDPEPYYLLGVVYQRWSKMEVAEDYYQQAWDHKATEPRYMLAVVEMKITLGKLDEAQSVLEAKMDYFEQSAALRIALARIAALKGDYAAASRHYRDAYLLVPDDEGVKRSYAETLYFAGKYADAAPMLEELRTRSNAGPGLMTPGGQPVIPVSAEEADADRTSLTIMLGEAYLNLHRPLDARTCFQEVMQTHADNLPALLGLGKVCMETNELGAALSAAHKVLRTEPQNVQAMILQAMVQEKQKQWAEAILTLQSASVLAPKDSTVMCMQGIALQRLGKSEDAVPFFERAIAANPNDHWASDLLSQARPVTLKATPAAGNPVDSQLPATSVTNATPAGRDAEGR